MSARIHSTRSGADATERLLVATRAALIELGIHGVSARAIAARAGRSASAIHYHYERLDDLIEAALETAREQDATWRAALIDTLRRSALGPELLPQFFVGVVDSASRTFRELALLRWDVALEAALHRRFVAVANRWRRDLDTFWTAALEVFGVVAPASLVAELADAIGRIFQSVGTGPTHVAWVTQTCQFVAECLLGHASHECSCAIWRDFHRADARDEERDAAQGASSVTKGRIIDGALAVIHQHGPLALTHRAVAAAGGVSLSSTTYHFASRGDILRTAFSQLRANAVARTLNRVDAGTSLTVDQLLDRMNAALVCDGGRVSRDYLTTQWLLHAAARDPALKLDAQDLYARMGEPTLALFRRTHELHQQANALAAFIFALWTDAMLCNASLTRGSTAAHVRARQRAMLGLLFRPNCP